MTRKKVVLGLDTSNYQTSLALISKEGETLLDKREYLTIPHGQKGLRQEEAFFQHINNLPSLMEDLSGYELLATAASVKPRPDKDSYMPCFRAGESFARTLAISQGLPFFPFSHQEGHIEASLELDFPEDVPLLIIQISGGTLEILKRDKELQVLAGSKDISFGQLLDRMGVELGMKFPAGQALDEIACKQAKDLSLQIWDKTVPRNLKAIHIDNGFINLSGLDTRIKRQIEAYQALDKSVRRTREKQLVLEVFLLIAEALEKLINYWLEAKSIDTVLLTGGVSASNFIRNYFNNRFTEKKSQIIFGMPDLSGDNGVGIGRLGRKALW